MAITDKFSNVGEPGSATYLANPGYSMGGTSINIQTYVGWPTGKIIFDMYTTKLVGNEEKAADNTRTSWQGIHNGSGTITSLQKLSGNDQNYTAGTGTRVIITHSTHWANQLVDGITAHANQDGSLKTAAVQSALNLGTQALNGWNPIGYTASFVQNNGNKETVVNYAGDVTQTLSPGMKVAYTRSVAPPTQCMSFTASSSQYATKASPTGMTGITNTITYERKVYLNSYPTTSGAIANCEDGVNNGWGFEINSVGQLVFFYRNTGNTIANTHITLPLKRWVHVAVSATAATKTINFYIQGQLVASTQTSSAASAIGVPAAAFNIGTRGGANYYDGYGSEDRLWSTARTQAEILANMNNNLTGSESGLVGLWRGAGNFNDLTANANHLTATNGAIATQAANPFNLIEYGKITKVGAFSGGVTPVTVFTGTDCNIPNMALTSPLYSTQAAWYGFPAARSKWQLTSIYMIDATVSSPVAGTWYNLGGIQISLGAGQWELSGKSTSGGYRTTSGGVETVTTLSTSPTTATNPESSSWGGTESGFGGIGAGRFPLESRCVADQQSQTTWYLNTKTNTSSLVDLHNYGGITPTIITAKLAY